MRATRHSVTWCDIRDSRISLRLSHGQSAADLSRRRARHEYRARDAAMPDVTQALRDARDLLLVANRDNPKALGDFGFVVDDSPQAKAKAKPAP